MSRHSDYGSGLNAYKRTMSVKDYEESLMGGTAAHVSGGPDYLRTLADPDNYHNTRGTALSVHVFVFPYVGES